MRDFHVASPEPVEGAAPHLGALGPALRRFAGQQGAWPPVPPARVVHLPEGPAPVDTGEALEAGAAAVDVAVDGGANLVVVAGGQERLAALVLLAALTDRDPVSVLGTSTADGWASSVVELRDRLRTARPHVDDAAALLKAVGSGHVARLTGVVLQCAARRTPVLVSGATDVWAACLVAQRIAPAVGAWVVAGCSPGTQVAVAAVGELFLTPLLDLGIDAPEGVELALGLLLGALALQP